MTRLRVTVVWPEAEATAIASVELPSGATLADALAAVVADAATTGSPDLAYAIHGQTATGDTPLADGDRVEITPPLIADPRSLRRERAARRPIPKAPSRRKPRPGL